MNIEPNIESPHNTQKPSPSSDEYQLVSKHKLHDMKSNIEAIVEIHKSIGWTLSDDRMSIMRYKQIQNITTFALDKRGTIIGYSTLRRDPRMDKPGEAYLSFIAVHGDAQASGIGMELLTRTLYKAHKAGIKIVTLDHEDSDRLNNFYNSRKIACVKISEVTDYQKKSMKYKLDEK